MNKGPKLIAVLVVIFIFGIQLLVFESYQSLFPTSDKNDNNYLTFSAKKEKNDNNDDNNDDDVSKICNKLLDSETCKKIEEEIKSKTKKLTKETQEEAITSKYLEPADSNQNTINNIEQTTESEQIGNSEPKQNEIVKSDSISQNPFSSFTPSPSTP
ncbi:MAG: hypothetical protein ACM3VV_00795, partial [Deltaproteobacteria bacterium]